MDSSNSLHEQFINTIPDKKQKKIFFHTYARTEWGKKRLQREALEVWEKLLLELKIVRILSSETCVNNLS